MSELDKSLGLVVCMPTRGAVAIETMLCLRNRLDDYPHVLKVAFRKPVIEARNQLAKDARELDPATLLFEPKYVLCTDDDLWWPRGHISRCVGILEENADVDMVCGIYSLRATGIMTCHYTFDPATLDKFTMIPYLKDGNLDTPNIIDRLYSPSNYEDGELAKLAFGEPGWAVMRRSLFDRVGNDPFDRIRFDEFPGYGPDFARTLLSDAESFCVRVNRCGGKIVTERSLLVGHVDVDNGLMYFPYVAPRVASGLSVPTQDAPLSLEGTTHHYYADSLGEDVWKRSLPEFMKGGAL